VKHKNRSKHHKTPQTNKYTYKPNTNPYNLMKPKNITSEKLAITARKSLSKYCYTECKAYCCRKGYLLLTAKEVKLIQNTHKKNLKITPTNKKKYIFNLGSNTNGCPNLQNYKCTIHKNPARPKACKEFPLFIWKNKTIMVTHACPAVKENKLYPYLAKFKTMKYKIIYNTQKN
jgi:Fe-S-cluster containining protein